MKNKIKVGEIFTCKWGIVSLDKLRQDIDLIDREFVALLSRRFCLTYMVGRYKALNNLPAIDKSREDAQFIKLKQLSYQAGLDEKVTKAVVRLIIDLVVERHQKM